MAGGGGGVDGGGGGNGSNGGVGSGSGGGDDDGGNGGGNGGGDGDGTANGDTPRHATSEKHLTIFGLGPLGLAWALDHIFRPLLQPIDVNDRNLILKGALGGGGRGQGG